MEVSSYANVWYPRLSVYQSYEASIALGYVTNNSHHNLYCNTVVLAETLPWSLKFIN